MIRFFKKYCGASGSLAKERLSSLVRVDRLAVTENTNMEKIIKEVTAVIRKYTDDNETVPDVRITFSNDEHCVLAAKIPLGVKEKLN